MRHYELVVVLSPMLNQEQASTAWGRIKDFITNRSAELDHEETWGTRRLAYAIKKGPYHFPGRQLSPDPVQRRHAV